ncbi:SDR family oxidoreductase [Nitratireductor mangrovi]|nr:SDR family NAD(P)-dependent oxidoreductase [Nitratireductor mangrovi]
MPKTLDFSGRKVLLTGGARGIGREMTRLLVARGARIVAIGRDAATLEALRQAHPGAVLTRQADLADAEAVANLARWIAADHADTSVLINNAAIMNHCELMTPSPARFDDIALEIAINLTAPMKLSAALLPVLGAHPSAAIVNVTTGLAIAPKRGAAVYCATKAGLRSFTRSLRDQCRHAGLPIQVSEAVMTLVDTTLSSAAPKKYPPERAAADVIAGVERGRDEIWIEKTKLLRVVHRLSPALACRIMRDR